jgi:quinol monooxygenase YgiN
VIALFIEHRTLPGRRADVEAVWERIMAPAVRDNRGHVLYAYCADNADPDVICAFQVYGDEAAATAFLQTDAYRLYDAEVRDLLIGPPTVTRLTPRWIKPQRA